MTDETFKNLALLRHTNKLASEVTTEVINEKSHELGLEEQLKALRKEKNDLLKKIKEGSANQKQKNHYFELMTQISELEKQKKQYCQMEYEYKKGCQKVVKDAEKTEKDLLGLNKEVVREKTVSELNNMRSVREGDASTKGV